jgi:hypothetical protein
MPRILHVAVQSARDHPDSINAKWHDKGWTAGKASENQGAFQPTSAHAIPRNNAAVLAI